MPKIVRNEIEYSSTTSTANQINYLNTTSGLSATNVQGAIDEVASEKADQSTTYTKTEVDNSAGGKTVTIGAVAPVSP